MACAKLSCGTQTKPLDIRAARLQGIYDNMKFLSSSEAMHVKNTKLQPCVFHGTRSINFMDMLQDLGFL